MNALITFDDDKSELHSLSGEITAGSPVSDHAGNDYIITGTGYPTEGQTHDGKPVDIIVAARTKHKISQQAVTRVNASHTNASPTA